MRCNSCGQQLDIDLDNLQAHCPYCGQKMMIDFEQLSVVLQEKEKTKQLADQESNKTKRTQMAYEHEAKEHDKDWKRKVIGAIGIVLVCFFVFYFMPNHLFDSQKKAHIEKVAYLQQLEEEIDQDIENKNYDSALLKVNKLYCDDNWSSEETETWNQKRKTYTKLIDKLKKEEKKQSNN